MVFNYDYYARVILIEPNGKCRRVEFVSKDQLISNNFYLTENALFDRRLSRLVYYSSFHQFKHFCRWLSSQDIQVPGCIGTKEPFASTSTFSLPHFSLHKILQCFSRSFMQFLVFYALLFYSICSHKNNEIDRISLLFVGICFSIAKINLYFQIRLPMDYGEICICIFGFCFFFCLMFCSSVVTYETVLLICRLSGS